MPKDYDVRFVMIADDVRKEDTGKDIIIGAYNDSLVVPTVPMLLPTFAIWVQAVIRKLNFEKIQATINDPNSNLIAKIEGALKFDNSLFPAAFSFKISPLMIHMHGVYTIYLGMDCELEKIAQFEALSPEQLASRKVDKA